MLRLRDISAGYGQWDVVSHIDLDAVPGTITTIVGKNGCGKSTLLKVCAGLLQPKNGEIRLGETLLSAYDPVTRAKAVSYLSQSRNTPGISAERLVMHGRYPHRNGQKKLNLEDWAKIGWAMRQTDVYELRNKGLQTLSGGERQRVYLAMTLAQAADVLLLDEPTTYLDLDYQLRLMELLTALKRSGKTIVMVLHDLEQALRFSDQIVVMEQGEIVQTGRPEELLRSGVLDRVFRIHISQMVVENEPCYLFRQQKSLAV